MVCREGKIESILSLFPLLMVRKTGEIPQTEDGGNPMRDDEKLQKDVMDELKWEPIIHAEEIGVSV